VARPDRPLVRPAPGGPMTGWSDVDDHGEPELRRAWRVAPDDPPLVVATDVDVPLAVAVGGAVDVPP